tara:strand:+ start:1049 stop:1507 length:459 start_codon:yes stop_codon:yes gene_type:complete
VVVAETLAGIALVKSATEAIKGAISTANDVGSLAKEIDKLFEGEKQIQRDKMQAQNPLSMKSVAEETINAKLAQEHMDEMRQLVDMRFGHGTWQGIIAERARRIHEIKEAEKRERIRKQKAKDDAIEVALIVLGVSVGVIVIVAILWAYIRI